MQIEFGTIRQIRKRLILEGYCISEYALRQWVRKKIIPSVYSGNRAYITYANVLRALHCNKNGGSTAMATIDTTARSYSGSATYCGDARTLHAAHQ